ncbi:MAG TPA: cobalamin-binding protein [Bacillota bacterium]|nr:cobalamin-binding protein [Bacillota bacterium]HRC53952.1 cobalamin-binding protein [Bacillota bacterium]
MKRRDLHNKKISRNKITPALALVLLIASIGMLVAGCKSKPATFTDGVGRTISLEKTPEKIVSLSPAHTEILFALGLGDKVIGVSNWCNKPEEALDKEKVGDAFSLDKEKLVSLQPDIVFIPGSKDSPQVKEIEDLGIPVYVSNPASVSEVFDEIKRVAEVTGVKDKGQQLADELQNELDGVKQKLEAYEGNKVKVLVLVDPELWTVGPGSFIDEVVALAGGENAMADVDMQYLQVSMEEVLSRDPDVILVTVPEDQCAALAERPGWTDLRAVKEGRVYYVDGDLVSRPGPNIVEAIKEVAGYLYPDLELGE